MGGGGRWREEQAEVLDHAEKLHYDHSAGGSLIPETDDKGKWVAWRDKFGAWKDTERAKSDAGQAWWQTYPASQTPSGGEGGSRSGASSRSAVAPGILDGDIPRGPYPLPNAYFPMLTTDYVRPQAISGDTYMNQYFNQGAYQVPNSFGALSYQPGTQQYYEAYPMEEGILEYQPPEFSVGPLQYYAPISPLEIEHHEESSGSKKKKDGPYDWATDPEGQKSGDGSGRDRFGIDGPAHGGWPADTDTVGGLMPGEQGYSQAVANTMAADNAEALGDFFGDFFGEDDE